MLRCLAKEPDARFPTMMRCARRCSIPRRTWPASPPIVATARPDARTVYGARRSQMVDADADAGRDAQTAAALAPPPPSRRRRRVMADGMVASAPPEMPAAAATLGRKRRRPVGRADRLHGPRHRRCSPATCDRMVPVPVENGRWRSRRRSATSRDPPRRWRSIVLVAGAARPPAAVRRAGGVAAGVAARRRRDRRSRPGGRQAAPTHAGRQRRPSPTCSLTSRADAEPRSTTRPARSSARTPAVVELPIATRRGRPSIFASPGRRASARRSWCRAATPSSTSSSCSLEPRDRHQGARARPPPRPTPAPSPSRRPRRRRDHRRRSRCKKKPKKRTCRRAAGAVLILSC